MITIEEEIELLQQEIDELEAKKITPTENDDELRREAIKLWNEQIQDIINSRLARLSELIE